MSKSLLKEMLNSLINEDKDGASDKLHQYLAIKAKELSGGKGTDIMESKSDPEIVEKVKALKGKIFKYANDDGEFTITKVEHRPAFGNNFNIYFSPKMGGSHHPYPNQPLARQIGKLAGLKARWSESGMQFDMPGNYLNLDFS